MTVCCILYGNRPGVSVYIGEARCSEMKAKQNAFFDRIVSHINYSKGRGCLLFIILTGFRVHRGLVASSIKQVDKLRDSRHRQR